MKRKVEWMEDSANDGDKVDTYFSAVNGLSSTSAIGMKKMKMETDSHTSQMDCSNSESISHEQRLTQSLDQALTSALGSMPSYTARFMKSQQPGFHMESAGSPPWTTASTFTGIVLEKITTGNDPYIEQCRDDPHRVYPASPAPHVIWSSLYPWGPNG
ncbi:unnamed protein product [Ranitomeya imitator]|uniref:Uncharacterized protein n=1 Tax=Ranitomeya imitator TaxID=111125 RepID=A0ABN9L6P1_9NEOB|nr:unnamed protein product [Ranitomeya imitator]